MFGRETVHILDRDLMRRGAIARQLFGFGMHAEIYEGLGELSGRPLHSGFVLACDDEAGPATSEIVRMIARKGSTVPVAMYSAVPDPERIVSAMLSGALDYLTWPFDLGSLERSFERLDSSSRALGERRRKEAEATDLVERLSVREKQVLGALVNGASNKEIGTALDISPRTVEIHRANMMRKLNAARTPDAVRIGLFAGLGS